MCSSGFESTVRLAKSSPANEIETIDVLKDASIHYGTSVKVSRGTPYGLRE